MGPRDGRGFGHSPAPVPPTAEAWLPARAIPTPSIDRGGRRSAPAPTAPPGRGKDPPSLGTPWSAPGRNRCVRTHRWENSPQDDLQRVERRENPAPRTSTPASLHAGMRCRNVYATKRTQRAQSNRSHSVQNHAAGLPEQEYRPEHVGSRFPGQQIQYRIKQPSAQPRINPLKSAGALGVSMRGASSIW